MKNNKEIQTKIFRNILIFLLLVFLTFHFIFKHKNIGEIYQAIVNVDIRYIVIAILCMVFFIVAEGTNFRRALTALGSKVSFFKGVKYASVGFFFSSVTPAATGGTPMQLYFMQKDDLPISNSTLAALIELCSYQLAGLLISFFGFIYQFYLLNNSIGGIKYLYFFGVLVNLVTLSFLFIAIFSDKLIAKIIGFIEKILLFFKYSKMEQFGLNMEEQIENYRNGGKFIKKHKSVLLKIFLITLVQMVLYFSIPYWIYLAFGLSGYSFLTFVALQSVLYIAVASLPLPGGVGINEGSFMVLFKLLFPSTILGGAMVLSRGVSFYFAILGTGIIILISLFIKRKIKNYKTIRLETKRLIIDKGSSSASKKVYEYDLTKCTGIDGQNSLIKFDEPIDFIGDDVKKYYEECKNNKMFDWYVYLKKEKVPVSNIVAGNEIDETIELSYNTRPDYWGKGYIVEALKKIISHLKRLGYKKIIIHFYEGNEKSKRICEKLGFEFVKKAKSLYKVTNKEIDEYEYVLNL